MFRFGSSWYMLFLCPYLVDPESKNPQKMTIESGPRFAQSRGAWVCLV